MRLFRLLFILLAAALPALAQPDVPKKAFLFAYFTGNGEDGLHLAWSRDGFAWEAVGGGKSHLTPVVGEKKLMRDPCVVRGPDGVYHLVWTTAWEGKTIGHASTRDFITWSEQQAIPVMAHEPDARNCWAPEIVYDDKKQHFLIFWATTIRGRFPETQVEGDAGYNHRIYATTTKDFKTFTPTQLFYEPGFNVIDATLFRDGRHYRMIVKDETKEPVAKKHLRVSSSRRPEGPWPAPSPAFTRDWVEGPTALKIGRDWIVYFDAYREKHYGAMRTRDFESWEDVTAKLSMPPGLRHGTALEVPGSVVEKLLMEK
ncbi:MAG TPA: glycoside hydrolase family 43 protein [Opitutaceae bacterium]